MKLLTLIILFLSLTIGLFANTAQPGIWKAGGTGTYSLLYPEDSTDFRKVQMVCEQVFVQLYHGFAVVKGRYWMYNTTPDTISLRAGYPVNSSYKAEQDGSRADIYFDDLYSIKVQVDGLPLSLEKRSMSDPSGIEIESEWFIWENEFPSLDTTLIEVWFIVNTNQTVIRKGYALDRNNGFIYLLESGSSWKQPIREGTVFIQLMNGIELSDIRGIRPDSVFSFNVDKKLLKYHFTDLEPGAEDNIILIYTRKVEEFDFGAVTIESSRYFSAIDQFARLEKENMLFRTVRSGDPFEVRSKSFIEIMVMAAYYFILLMLVAGLAAIIWVVVRRRERKAPH